MHLMARPAVKTYAASVVLFCAEAVFATFMPRQDMFPFAMLRLCAPFNYEVGCDSMVSKTCWVLPDLLVQSVCDRAKLMVLVHQPRW